MRLNTILSIVNFAAEETQVETFTGTIFSDSDRLSDLRALLTGAAEGRNQSGERVSLSEDIYFERCESDQIIMADWQELLRLSWQLSAASRLETVLLMEQTVLDSAVAEIDTFLAAIA